MEKLGWKILAAFAVILLFGAGVILALQNSANTGNSDGSRQQASEALILETPKGRVQVRDFTKNPAEQTAGAMVLAETPDYGIIYYANDQSFVVTLLSVPAFKARTAAESAFLDALNINPAEACKLQVSLTIPLSVDEALAGRDYGLSFCPSGIQF